MAIQRRDPMRDLIELQERIKRLFDDVLSRGGSTAGDAGAFKPPMDLVEEPNRYVLRVDLPGIAAGEVEIQVENGTLTLRGERKIDSGVSKDAYLRIERPHGRFSAQLELPPTVERDGIKATHSNGVVEIALPKKRQQAPDRIRIAAT